jgi:hypothetical protein
MIIKTRNLQHIGVPKTYLTNPVVSGTNVLPWKNPAGFNASWGIQVGEMGEEQTEVVVLSASTPAGTAGTISGTLLYDHPSDTPIYGIKYDQVIFERSTAGTAGTATPMTSGTVTYQADGTVTQFDDTSGASTYAYRARYYNATLGSTSQSDWITPQGFQFYSLASIRRRVKDKLWDSTYIRDDLTIDNWINEYKDEMSNAIISVNQDFAIGTVDIGFGTNGLGTITTDDFTQPRRFEVSYDGGATFYLSNKIRLNSYLPNETWSSSHPTHNWLGDSVFQVHPSDTAGTARLTFYRFGTTMVNDTDTLPLPMRSYTKGYVDYALSQALFKDGRTADAQLKMAEAMAVKNTFVSDIVPRDQTGPTTIFFTDDVSSDDNLVP